MYSNTWGRENPPINNAEQENKKGVIKLLRQQWQIFVYKIRTEKKKRQHFKTHCKDNPIWNLGPLLADTRKIKKKRGGGGGKKNNKVKSVMDIFCPFPEWSKKMQLFHMTLLKEKKISPSLACSMRKSSSKH